jgi:hypothetical protein
MKDNSIRYSWLLVVLMIALAAYSIWLFTQWKDPEPMPVPNRNVNRKAKARMDSVHRARMQEER